MTDTERTRAIRAEHYSVDGLGPKSQSDGSLVAACWCQACDMPWPCDTSVVLDALAAAQGEVGRLRAEALDFLDHPQTIRSDGAYRPHLYVWPKTSVDHFRAALAERALAQPQKWSPEMLAQYQDEQLNPPKNQRRKGAKEAED